MSPLAWQIATMVVYLVAMLLVGWYSYRRTHDLGDYMLGGRDLPPSVAALSAGASDMSGWLLMGLPGAIYASGLVESWIAVGLTVGAWANWKWVAPRLRAYSEVANDSITVPSFFENRLHDRSRALRMTSAVIILVFFTFYVSSGMTASGVFYQSSFGRSYEEGLLVISAVTVAYTLFGGFLAVSYTDFLQGVMMVAALVAVPLVGLFVVGGLGEVSSTVRAVDPDFLSLVQGATVVGVVSSLAWGLGYFGQPHIITRFMALRSADEAVAGRRIGIGWMIFSVTGAICTALVGLTYFRQHPELAITDPETVYIRMGQILFHPIIAGFMLAAVLAAIMSTMSSQLIVTSSALVEDIYRAFGKASSDTRNVLLGRLAVLVVALIAGWLAWEQNATILRLVSFAWAGFGGALGPIVLLSLYWRKLTWQGALSGMIVGALTVGFWGPSSTWGGTREDPLFGLYEIVPGFALNLLVAVVVSMMTYRRNEALEGEFDAMRTLGHEIKAEEKQA
ncbi:sodium/proline symporter PutP [Mobilicoccus caccae]|uniref:Sodium/proline symporter n=1 Tax=Mobilicoccus caccae TaxID=1859295 RepID=A0ABQ6IW19_9MICO|nr:sodium/proline symporter PutP [Mobilicoccus caccae]GMA41488.1 sodium:proline symporter [Mobilicoccus caccae]